MSKRFIDTGIFDDDWFMDLSKDAKLLWIYFITKCDHAGMLKLNEKLCRVQTDVKDLPEIIKQLGNRLVTVSEHLYFIPKYIEFQYPGFPNSKVRQQISAVEILKKHNLFDEEKQTVRQGLTNTSVNDNVIVNVTEPVKKPEKIKKTFVPPSIEEVINFFTEKGYESQAAIRAFNHYDLANWHDTSGKPVISWKQKMSTNWFTEENKINGSQQTKPIQSVTVRNGEDFK